MRETWPKPPRTPSTEAGMDSQYLIPVRHKETIYQQMSTREVSSFPSSNSKCASIPNYD
jgi:hypothetical protein